MRQSHILSLLSLLGATGVSAAPSKGKVPKGFVTTEGDHFKLDGKDFYFAGSNAYYFPFNVCPPFPIPSSDPIHPPPY